MRLYFIRHAQSENNLLYERTGSSQGRSIDPQITDLGQRQVELLAQFFCTHADTNLWEDPDSLGAEGFNITHLYTSLMVRSVETGTILSQSLGLPLVAWSDVHEGGGIYMDDEVTGEPIGLPGYNRDDFEKEFPNLVLPDWLDEIGWWNRPFEDEQERKERARRFLKELWVRHGETGHRVAVISHGGFYNHFIKILLNLPEHEGFWFMLNNTGYTRIDFESQNTVLVYQNRTDHLSREMIS